MNYPDGCIFIPHLILKAIMTLSPWSRWDLFLNMVNILFNLSFITLYQTLHSFHYIHHYVHSLFIYFISIGCSTHFWRFYNLWRLGILLCHCLFEIQIRSCVLQTTSQIFWRQLINIKPFYPILFQPKNKYMSQFQYKLAKVFTAF